MSLKWLLPYSFHASTMFLPSLCPTPAQLLLSFIPALLLLLTCSYLASGLILVLPTPVG